MTLEKNIERIADALEAIAKMVGVKADATAPSQNLLVQRAEYRPDQQTGGRAPVQPANQGNWSPQMQPAMQADGQPPRTQQPLPQGGTVPVSVPPGSGMPWPGSNNIMPSGNPQQQSAGAGMVPTTASPKQYTFDQLAVATANLASSGKDVFTVLGRFGVSMLMDLPLEKYGEYAAALREAGGVI